MESYDEFDDIFPWIKIIGIGSSGTSTLNHFGDVADDIFPARLIIADENDVANLQDFVVGTSWVFVIADVEDLNFAAQVAKTVEQSNLLITSLISCPTAADVRLANIPDNFGTWIILLEDNVPWLEDIFPDGNSKFEFVRNELLNNKILRQGWGVEDLRNGQDAYVKREHSKGNTDAKEAKKRFNILKPMLDIKVGDRIVIPRLSLRNNQKTSGKYFTTAAVRL